MYPLVWNLGWMSWNTFLSVIGVWFGYRATQAVSTKFKLIWAALWLLFMPNTIYILTDIKHLVVQWYQVYGIARALLSIQYLVFISAGVAAYVLGVRLYESHLTSLIAMHLNHDARYHRYLSYSIVILNFALAYGLVMGRILRTNSWHVVTQPLRVMQDAIAVGTSASLMMLVIAFWFIANGIYFTYRTVRLKS